MQPSEGTSVRLAVEALGRRLGTTVFDLHLGQEGDYFRLVRTGPSPVDASVSCCGLPEGRYSVQICLGGDPLNIAYDDECDLSALIDMCGRYFSLDRLTPDPVL